MGSENKLQNSKYSVIPNKNFMCYAHLCVHGYTYALGKSGKIYIKMLTVGLWEMFVYFSLWFSLFS
jgi:hypothetical protein